MMSLGLRFGNHPSPFLSVLLLILRYYVKLCAGDGDKSQADGDSVAETQSETVRDGRRHKTTEGQKQRAMH